MNAKRLIKFVVPGERKSSVLEFTPTPAAWEHVRVVLDTEDYLARNPGHKWIYPEKPGAVVEFWRDDDLDIVRPARYLGWAIAIALCEENARFQQSNPDEVAAAKDWRASNLA